jgi:extracellular factor (EF) 3-hydroxypalmitic acid methyl ester biosynthesis protein
MGARDCESNKPQVTFETSQGLNVQGTAVRLTRYALTFEVYDPAVVLQTSEVLGKFQIIAEDRVLYTGRAVIAGIVHTGLLVICEARLDNGGMPVAFEPPTALRSGVKESYDRFFQEWQKDYHIAREFKVVVADLEAYLSGVERWLAQMELGLLARDDGQRLEQERELVESLAPRIIAAVNSQHERFEELACAVPPDLLGVHENFVRRHWHKVWLCAPFAHRTYYKPLGHAGDYEMMNMIHRNQPEGNSLYARLIHFLLVSQWPARSVRNRIAHLKQVILHETSRAARLSKPCRVLNVGCGPAREIQCFFQENSPGYLQEFTLLDFNQETLSHASSRLAEVKRQFGHRARVETRNISVYQLLRGGTQRGRGALKDNYDLIYCTGLFDYLPDATCRALVDIFYNALEPGGLVVVANMKDDKPFRYFIEFVLDWRLIYRDAAKLWTFAPERALETARVETEDTSVNLFLHVRKPA